MTWTRWVASAPMILEGFALAAILFGIAWSLLHGMWQIWRGNVEGSFNGFRGNLARSILIGLELLVGADILRTLGREPDFYELGTLAAIVLIRSFLSATMEMELVGHWPWQKTKPENVERHEASLRGEPC